MNRINICRYVFTTISLSILVLRIASSFRAARSQKSLDEVDQWERATLGGNLLLVEETFIRNWRSF